MLILSHEATMLINPRLKAVAHHIPVVLHSSGSKEDQPHFKHTPGSKGERNVVSGAILLRKACAEQQRPAQEKQGMPAKGLVLLLLLLPMTFCTLETCLDLQERH